LTLNRILLLKPEYRDYVWGGSRLRPEHVPTAEAWVVYENDVVLNGPCAGRSLADLAAEFGEQCLGTIPFQQTGARFPLLIKLLDCAQWLSLQVHPDDEQARRLEGPGFYGKTEAWHILDATPDARIIAGLRPGVQAGRLAAAIRDGSILDWVQYHPVHAGDSIFMAPGTIHALGPGLLVYEVQQTSDLTYRVYDWDRPQTPNRPLHIEKSLAVVKPAPAAEPHPLAIRGAGRQTLAACNYFTLEHIDLLEQSVTLHTRGLSFHALTIIDGRARIQAGDESEVVEKFDTCGEYAVQPLNACRLLKSSVDPV
jgi:mannose-6-phosphate isomerase